ncbi:MAG: Rhs element Vgr protein [Flavobacterium psychrophilum]|nr:MAG: Rhs element Vgr protein [Flavobacterium psychrophilum]
MTATINPDNPATFSILTNGNPIPDQFSVFSVTTQQGVNRIATAKIVILDGDANTGTFEVSSSALFVPGNTITVQVGYDNNNQTIFTGIVTRQTIRIDSLIGSALEVECHDESIRMTVGRKNKSFTNQKDSDVIASIIGTYPNLLQNVTDTTVTIPTQLQYYVTDWDFITSLAENNGLIITTLQNKISVFRPDADPASALKVTYGDNLIEFNANLDAISQLGSVKANAWDFTTQSIISGQGISSYSGPGNLSPKHLSEVIGLSDFTLQTPAPLHSDSLNNWSNAQQKKSEYGKIQGEVKFQGTSLAVPGKYITMAGLGDRFNGDYIISSVEHNISLGTWDTTVNLGMPSSWFVEDKNISAPPASGLTTGINGLFTGTVINMHQDPDSQYRIQVSIAIAGNETVVWARLASLYATNGAGTFFLPEVGDEVVMGFLNDDARYPVILGSLYSSSANKPFTGLTPSEKNPIKAIVSKSGINIQFDDENKICTVTTPSKNTVVLSDKDKQITLQDQNNNSITMSDSGITIKSPKNISIEADQNISIKGTQGVKTTSSGGDIQTSGMNIKHNAQTEYTAQGSVTAKVTAGAQLTLKGAIVMIN